MYRGTKHQCNICDIKLRQFIEFDSSNLLCPNCGSLSRTRGLWNIINDQLSGKILLHFSPSISLKTAINTKANTKKYITTDFSEEFDAEFNFDIENISLDDCSVDIIICFHILEHVQNDRKALSELYRVLKKNGTIYIQTPFKEGSTYEDSSIVEPEERLKHFGQEDHLRVYSSTDLNSRIQASGFETKILEINNEKDNYNGLKQNEIILVGKKV
ncbi:class I SAM-dependent methyltransferase [Saprospiraceae bacterium]|nr:class I SAM-dependent methyltransferase [Saprospiraceae bacterium]